jgi:Rod binding domain-containing protein
MNLESQITGITQAIPPATLTAPKPGTLTAAEARAVGEDFEAVFLSEMLRPIFATVEADSLFGGGSGERITNSLLINEYGKAIAKGGGVGIADAVARELINTQEIGQ